jgi:hypothetical protein
VWRHCFFAVDHLVELVRGSISWAGPLSIALFIPTRAHLDAAVVALPDLARCGNVSTKVTLHLAVVTAVWELDDIADIVANIPTTWSRIATFSHESADPAATTCAADVAASTDVVTDRSTNYARGIPYPNNMLRNLARAHARTPWSLVIDVDMIVAPPDLFHVWRDAGRRGDLQSSRPIAYVLPAFEVSIPSTSTGISAPTNVVFPRSHDDVVAAFNHTVRPFYFEPCFKCQRHSNYTLWLGEGASASLTYHVPYHDPWEPFYVSKTSITPPYDERFKQYGFNRISQICGMWMAGFDFHVVRRGFVLHGGWKVKEKFHPQKQAEQDANRLIYRALKEELKAKYPGQRRCNVHGYHV